MAGAGTYVRPVSNKQIIGMAAGFSLLGTFVGGFVLGSNSAYEASDKTARQQIARAYFNASELGKQACTVETGATARNENAFANYNIKVGEINQSDRTAYTEGTGDGLLEYAVRTRTINFDVNTDRLIATGLNGKTASSLTVKCPLKPEFHKMTFFSDSMKKKGVVTKLNYGS